MASQFKYVRPGPVHETSTYNYNGQQIDVSTVGLCLDCSTPTVWVEDDLTVTRIYHDPSCIQVRMGQGQVTPFVGRQLPQEAIGYEEHEQRRRDYQRWWRAEKQRRGLA
jgi:hypothetical protein